MNKKEFNKKTVIEHWVKNADDDYDTMIAMLNSKRYSWSLFLGHLVIEKLLKAYFVEVNNKYPPFTHNLLRLAIGAKIEITDELKFQLISVSAFNINARYDDYKNSFQKRCTPEFTLGWIKEIKELRLWILKQIKS